MRWLKAILIIILVPILLGAAVLIVAGRPLAFEVLQRRTAIRFPEIKWISTADLARWQSDTGQPQALVLDARTPAEYEVSHLRDAVWIDPYRPSLNPVRHTPKTEAIVVYSSAGYRGARLADWLRRNGYTSVVNLAGGIFKWVNEGNPVFKQGNRPTALVHPYDRRWGYLVDRTYRAEAPDVEKRSAAP